MKAAVKRDKEAKFVQVAQAVVVLLPQRGVRGLTISAVARAAGVSRTWIYRYIGQTQGELLQHAARYFVTIFTGLADPGADPSGNREAWWHGGMGRIQEQARQSPDALRLYFQFAGASHELGRMLAPVLEIHQQRQAAELQKEQGLTTLQAAKVSLVWDAVRLGLAFEASVARRPSQLGDIQKSISDPELSRVIFSALKDWALRG